MKTNKLDTLDYAANRIAKGSWPGNAKYVFSKEDWAKFKLEVSTEVAKAKKQGADEAIYKMQQGNV